MEKICVFADVHQDLDILKRLINLEDFVNADKRIFLGDILYGSNNLGNECVDILKSINNCIFIMGNNDLYISYGIPKEDLMLLSRKKIAQLQQIKLSIKKENMEWIRNMPKIYCYKDIYFCHYPWEKDLSNIVDEDEELTLDECERIFKGIKSKHIIFAHKHDKYYFTAKQKDYLCLASLRPELNRKTEGVGEYAILTLDEKGLQNIELKKIIRNHL